MANSKRFPLSELNITLAPDEETLAKIDAINLQHALTLHRWMTRPLIFGTRRPPQETK